MITNFTVFGPYEKKVTRTINWQFYSLLGNLQEDPFQCFTVNEVEEVNKVPILWITKVLGWWLAGKGLVLHLSFGMVHVRPILSSTSYASEFNCVYKSSNEVKNHGVHQKQELAFTLVYLNESFVFRSFSSSSL